MVRGQPRKPTIFLLQAKTISRFVCRCALTAHGTAAAGRPSRRLPQSALRPYTTRRDTIATGFLMRTGRKGYWRSCPGAITFWSRFGALSSTDDRRPGFPFPCPSGEPDRPQAGLTSATGRLRRRRGCGRPCCRRSSPRRNRLRGPPPVAPGRRIARARFRNRRHSPRDRPAAPQGERRPAAGREADRIDAGKVPRGRQQCDGFAPGWMVARSRCRGATPRGRD